MNATPQTKETKAIPSHTVLAWPHANEFSDLARVAREALRMKPPLYFRSIFGPATSFLPPHGRFSEYNILNPWRLATMLRWFLEVSVPASGNTSPDWARAVFPPILNRLLWRPTGFFRQPDTYGGVCTFPREHWFFVNGVATNGDIAQLNAAYLTHLFHRPVSVIQKATDSLLLDLHECAIGKGFKNDPDSEDQRTMTEPAWRATPAVLEAVNAPDTDRVVVIAHSQGTIIMANVLRAIAKALRSKLATARQPEWHPFAKTLMGPVEAERETETQKILRDKLAYSLHVFAEGGPAEAEKKLAKLEIYTFANCADKMRYVYPRKQIPYLEHFANERDLVARLGILSPLRGDSKSRLIEIDGPVFERKGAWGHLLNEHHLALIDHYLYPRKGIPQEENPYPVKGGGPLNPRLYEYFHGNSPEEAEVRRPRAVSSRGRIR